MNYLGNGDDVSGDGVMMKRFRREDIYICEKCCAEFFSFFEFLEYKKNCIKNLFVFIMNDSEGSVFLEDFFGVVLSY